MSRKHCTLLAGALGVLLLLQSGCASIKSIMLYRDPTNTAWEKERHLPGIPITLKVPTHLRIDVIERQYLVHNDIAGVHQVTRAKLDVPVRQIRHEFLYTEKIFTVDFKRPAAGVIDVNATFKDDAQYFKDFKYHVEDKTIEAVTGLIAKIAPGGFFKSASEGSQFPNVETVDSVVAVRIFEIEAPDFEQQLAAFLDCHVNNAHDAWVVPPGVDTIQRRSLTDYGGNRGPLCASQGCGCEQVLYGPPQPEAAPDQPTPAASLPSGPNGATPGTATSGGLTSPR